LKHADDSKTEAPRTHAPPAPDAADVCVGALAREQLQARLREAWQLVRGDVQRALPRLREVVEEILTRLDSLALPLLAREAPAQPASQLPFTALSAARGEPVSQFLLIPFGQVTVERPVAGESFVFTPAHAESARRWFERMQRKLAIDYEHQSLDRCNTRSDGLRPAAGWIGGLEVRDDGLWAVDVAWTERARELLRTGEYRYFSPVIFWTDEDRTDVAALGPVALTNDPAMHGVAALAATRGPAPDAPRDPERALAAAREELAQLRRQLADQATDAFIERGLRLGKILESTDSDWRAEHQRDPELAEARLRRAPVLRPPGRICAPEALDASRATAASVVGAPGMTGECVVEAEDLAVFARAASAGRVRGLDA
jgi:hypothetical protein